MNFIGKDVYLYMAKERLFMFHLSKTPGLKVLKACIPEGCSKESGREDAVTRRVSFAPTINKCLDALFCNPQALPYGRHIIDSKGLETGIVSFDETINRFKAFVPMVVAENSRSDARSMFSIEEQEAKMLYEFMDKGYDKQYPVYYVYVPKEVNKNDIVYPSDKVFDGKLTGEMWITHDIEVECLCCIYVLCAYYTGVRKYFYTDIKTKKRRKGSQYQMEYLYQVLPPDFRPIMFKAREEKEKLRYYKSVEKDKEEQEKKEKEGS